MAVQDVMHTSNPIHEYEFSWTIDNFSLSPDVLRGPTVSPIPGVLENVCLELHVHREKEVFSGDQTITLNVFLIDLNAKNTKLAVSSYTTIRNTDDMIIEEDPNPSSQIFRGQTFKTFIQGRFHLLSYGSNPNFHFLEMNRKTQALNLLDDKLVVKGKLTFSGYQIDSSVSPVKYESKAYGELSKDLKTMYESGLSSDITFSVGKKTFRAHKNILISRSPVFAKMFSSDMLERNTKKVVIEDVDFHAFNHFLMFLYTGVVEDKKWNTLLSLYSLAHKYQVTSLHAICSGILGSSLEIDSVCNVLVLSDLHGDKVLKDAAKVFIRGHLQVVGTTEWNEKVIIKPQLLNEVLAFLLLKQPEIKK